MVYFLKLKRAFKLVLERLVRQEYAKKTDKL